MSLSRLRSRLWAVAASSALAIAAVAPAVIAPTPAAAAPPAAAAVAPSALAPTPPMGWNNWAHYGCKANNPFAGQVGINEDLFKTVADNLVSSGLAAKGYTTVTVDDCWMKGRDANGELLADPVTFPSGMKAIGDYFHARGLKYGIYQDAGSWTCTGQTGSGATSTRGDYFYQDAATFASWGVDFIKLDGCNVYVPPGQSKLKVYQDAYQKFSDAITATGRAMTFSVSEPAYFYIGVPDKAEWYDSLASSQKAGQLWREGTDIAMWTPTTTTGSARGSMFHNYNYNWPLARYSGPNSWNDPDFLLTGDNSLTLDQQKSQMALWSMMASPLIISSDASKLLDQTTKDILGNGRILAVDQDPMGVAATVVARNSSTDVLSRPLANGDRAFALLNRTASTATLSTTLEQIGYTTAPGCTYTVTNLWDGTTSTSTGTAAFSTPVAAYGTAIYRVSSPYGCGNVKPATLVTGPINSKGGCVSVAAGVGGVASPGKCDGSANQRFSLNGDGTIRGGGGLCLAATGGSGSVVQSATCQPGTTAQQWSYTTTGNLKNTSNSLCLDIRGGVSGTRLDTFTCGSSQANQVFQLPVTQATGAVHVNTTAPGEGTCLTVAGGVTTAGTNVLSSTCDGSASQNWIAPGDGTLRLAGKCLDNFNSGGVGSKLILWPCTGNSNQTWTYALNGNLVNGLPSRLCAGVRGATTTSGAQVETQTCGYNLATQLWTLPT
ncbi:ricin-type beta-trefoil lectin domain protein [Streptomyces sp. NBC_00347]|uniref:ricin-type beta-trefoil lectin domain protein n=1 Tax=Streptomyces sp. NBC_00347 TaxID=2975721 RepID=UPI0022531A67|nr:ricin-type beta-trefoil lectin domain protein [Streptomyces sp. NBC_00347]MCX5126765.1 ricin-type beta-trefoil lectin domain protein [Streptomyces sp. NBC_00347]